MGIEITTPTADQWPDMFRADARGFGFVPEPSDIETRQSIIDMSRFRMAMDRGKIVGVAGSYAMDVTLPGGSTVPMSGVTWVSVAATHRRQGLLTRLIEACHADTDERGEPVAMLFASEGGIYERFGYGIASHMRRVAIDRRAATFRPDLSPDLRAVEFIEGDDAVAQRERLWEQFRRQRAGEVSRSAAWQQFLADIWGKPSDGLTQAFFLAHDHGYAAYRMGENWTEGVPKYRLELVELVALTPQAHLDLWATIVGVDLVTTIGLRTLPLDDPLPYYFTDSRVVTTLGIKDGVWANVRDVATCFGARTYGTAAKMVIEADGRRWAIESDGAEASCRSVRTRPDLVTDHATLGALLFGGIRPSQLVAAGRLTARSTDMVRRADPFFVTSPEPQCLTYF
jgi:predicted acetyltransferase